MVLRCLKILIDFSSLDLLFKYNHRKLVRMKPERVTYGKSFDTVPM